MLKLKQDCARMVKLLWVPLLISSLGSHSFGSYWAPRHLGLALVPETKVLVTRLILVPRFPQV